MAIKTRAQPASESREKKGPSGHVVVCGSDELAFLIAQELQRLGDAVTLIAASEDLKFVRRARERGVSTITGDYREDEVLAAAAITSARAFVAADNDDVGNLHSALAAYEANPKLRIVLRVFNPEMGTHIQRVLPGATVLSSSAIAAPSLVSAALETDFEQRVEAAGRVLIVRHADVDDPAVLVPLGRDGEAGIELFPGEGDRLLCLCDGGEAGHTSRDKSTRQRRRRRLVPAEVRHLAQALMSVADSRLRYMLTVLAVLVAGSALILHATIGWGILDSVYFTLTTITTIGYGDLTPLNAAWPVKIYVMALELLGATALAIFFALVTDALVGARLRRALGSGLRHDVDEHLVVVGLGNMGLRIVEHVRRIGVSAVALDLDETLPAVQSARRINVPVVIGDARRPDALHAVNIENARCLLVTTDDDLANLEIALNARALSSELWIVVRLRDPDLAARVQRAIGHGVSRSTAALAAPGFVTATFGHRVVATIPVGQQMLVLAGVRVAGGSRAEGRSIDELTDDVYGRVLLVQREAEATWKPDAEQRLQAGDDLLVVATRRGLGELVRRTSADGKELSAVLS